MLVDLAGIWIEKVMRNAIHVKGSTNRQRDFGDQRDVPGNADRRATEIVRHAVLQIPGVLFEPKSVKGLQEGKGRFVLVQAR